MIILCILLPVYTLELLNLGNVFALVLNKQIPEGRALIGIQKTPISHIYFHYTSESVFKVGIMKQILGGELVSLCIYSCMLMIVAVTS